MKGTIVALCAILTVTTARVVINIEGQDTPHLLGAKACTWGPSYWCQNITTAAGCNATKHCIPKVWEKMQVPEDHDSVCEVCKDMVQQARDQLESNQTQEDLKAVFEGSCALIYIKPIVKECDKLVDQFIPELVETLASQMNPSVVCSVAGLCNSAHIDKLIEEYKQKSESESLEGSLSRDEYTPNECSKCYAIAQHMEYKFGQASRDKVLEQFLKMCGELSSLSDACSSIILTHFEPIYSHIKGNFNAQNVCHLSGQCSARFHVHEDETDKTPEVEIRPLSSVGMVDIGDDLPCKLCQQLVLHLRNLLIANTTETEFEQVLQGLCKQTKSFASECKAIVDEYYPQIYSYLTKGLDSNVICQMGGICPAPDKYKAETIWPLVSETHAKIAVRILQEKKSEPKVLEANSMQLPLKRITLPSVEFTLLDDKYCSSCEFVMHYIKQNVRNLKDRDEVKLVLSEVKSSLPGIKGDENFLNRYEEAVAVLILQGKDLSEICPLIAVCPTNQQIEAWKQIPAEFTEKSSIQDKPNCPLCLFAVTKLYDIVKDDKTEASIEAALDKLCNELPKSLTGQCIDLVKIYSKELVSLLLSDMTPQEVCAYIKLCDPAQKVINKPKLSIGEKIIAVPRNDVEGKQACALCEYILHYLQQAVTNPKAEDEVKQVLDKVCNKLPQSIQNDCTQFIDTYGDALVAILAQEIDPSQVCPMIHICPSAQLLEAWKQIPKEHVIVSKPEDKPNCPLCLFGVTQIYNAIKDNKTEASIEAAMDKLCLHLPKSLTSQCETLVDSYSKQIIEMVLADLTPQEVCVYLKLCDPAKNVEPTISFFPLDKDGEIMTNEIPNYPMYTVNTEKVEEDLECVVCKYVMQYVEKVITTRKSEDEIKHLIYNICDHLPSHLSQKCNNFVNEYAEIVIELLTQEVSPIEICTIVDLCKSETTQLRESVAECALCQQVITTIEKLLDDDTKSGENIEEIMTKVCKYLPTTEQGKCTMLMEIYEQTIINIIKAHGDTRKICSKLSLCSSNDFLVMLTKNGRIRRQVEDLGTKPCTWGISYWCVDDKTAEECKATELCKKKGRLPESTSTTAKATSDNRELASEAEQAVSKDAQSSS